jgi:hypothetical protein
MPRSGIEHELSRGIHKSPRLRTDSDVGLQKQNHC